MRAIKFLIILIFLTSCSFDNKSGIWINENELSSNKEDLFKEFKKISSNRKIFNKTVPLTSNYNFDTPKIFNNLDWKDTFYSENNNNLNFAYNDQNRIILKSKKLTRYKINNYILAKNNNLILNDQRGNIIVYSINENKLISKFNFYKKKYKNIKKKLHIIIEKNIIYVGDNLGYAYALNINDNKIIWAKNYKIPFRSNLKIKKNKIIISDQKNSLIFLDKTNGNLLNIIPTEETIVHNSFVNNLSLNNNDILFLNSFGSLYSINIDNMKINWFLNLKQSTNLNTTDLFFGNQIVNYKDKIIVSSNNNTYLINAINGSIIKTYNFSSNLKPIINNNHFLLITKNNLILAIDLTSNRIIYSYDVTQKVSNFLNSKKKNLIFYEMLLMNNKISFFMKNSFKIEFKINGELENIEKLPAKINSLPIVVNKSIMFVDNKNKLVVIN
jgi:outer membrane protein assembly factor BamB